MVSIFTVQFTALLFHLQIAPKSRTQEVRMPVGVRGALRTCKTRVDRRAQPAGHPLRDVAGAAADALAELLLRKPLRGHVRLDLSHQLGEGD